MPSPRLAAVLLAGALVLTGCGDSKPSPSAAPSAPLATLPPGDLMPKVLQPSEVSRDLVPIAMQTGTRDITSIAAYSSDPKAAQKTLESHGFQTAYVVQYADPASGAVVTNVVSKFATVGGALQDLAGDIGQAGATGTPFEVAGLGDQAGGVTGKRDPAAADGTLVTLRWRVGDTTWLLAVGARNKVDASGVRALADKLVARLSRAPSPAASTPSA